jgi:hypothetical protein
MRTIVYIVVTLVAAVLVASAQKLPTKGDDQPKGGTFASPDDTLFVFQSPRSLLTNSEKKSVEKTIGFNVLFSGSGYGGGLFYSLSLGEDIVGFANLEISPRRNRSEFEQVDPNTGRFFIPGKKHWLMMFPLMIGLNYKVFQNDLSESLRPYVSAGVGPTFVMASPYDYPTKYEFFNTLGDAVWYTRPGAFLGAGTYIGSTSKTSLAVNVRYYVIPFGGDGIESVAGNPITDFGGLFISLCIGFK